MRRGSKKSARERSGSGVRARAPVAGHSRDAARAGFRLEDVFDALPDRVLMLNTDGVCLSSYGRHAPCSATLSAQLRCDSAADALPPGLVVGFRAALAHARDSGSVVEWEYSVGRGAETLHYEARIARAKRGTLICIVRDVTARVRARALSAEVERLRRDLAGCERSDLVGRLMAALTHELGQPLTAILSNAEAAQTRLRTADCGDEVYPRIVSDIIASSERAQNVLGRLRRLLRSEDAPREPLDLNTLVCDVALTARTELVTRHVELVLHLAPDLARIRASRTQLQQVILQLLLNAVEAMQSLEEGSRQVLIRTSASDVGLELAIEDRGGGFGGEQLSHMFQPLFSTKTRGFGMGLAVSADIVREHGGTISAENGPAGGALVRVRLPAMGDTPAEARSATVERSGTLGTELILLELESVMTRLDVASDAQVPATACRNVKYAAAALRFIDKLLPKLTVAPGQRDLITARRLAVELRLNALNSRLHSRFRHHGSR